MLDDILAFLLLVVLPARALWRSRTNRRASRPKAGRYLVTIMMVGGLLGVLAADWLTTGRTAAALGLAAPTTMAAMVGLGLAVTLLVAMGMSMRRKPAPADVQQASSEMLPDTPGEVRLFLLFALAVGFGWEVLYRGFLLAYLQPHVGLVAAVIVAALAYGAAHGFKNVRQFGGSIAVALAFTVGYALTANLWWLILLHMSLPLLTLFAMRGSEASSR